MTTIVRCFLFTFYIYVLIQVREVLCEDVTTKECQGVKYFADKLSKQDSELSMIQSKLNQCQKISSVAKNRLMSISDIFFYPPFVYNKKQYIISKFPHNDVNEAMTYCTAFDGYLAEIDDVEEYKALQSFVVRTPNVDIVVIAGSDALIEGSWIFQRTGAPLTVFDWSVGQPDNLGNEDCFNLWKRYGGKMNDLPCGFRSNEDRFMCEIPDIDNM